MEEGEISKMNYEELNKIYGVSRKKGDTCEYEVCKTAMDCYKDYPCYKDPSWRLIENSNSVFAYYQNSDRTEKGYKGAYLLVNETDNIALTGDILTSIYHPFISIILEERPLNGKGLSDLYKKMDISQYFRVMKDYSKYMKAFAQVYYWCGNMMPVICNWKGKNDEGIYKIGILHSQSDNSIKDYIEQIEHGRINGRNVKPAKFWPIWRSYQWSDWKDFVDKYRLNDYVDDSYIPRDISLFSVDNLEDWMITNSKLIIQRSYRIKNPKMKGWKGKREDGKTHKDFVIDIFREVFVKGAGMAEQDYPGLLNLF